MSGLTDYQRFVADASASNYFGNWKKQNPGEYSRWLAFDKAVQAGPADPIVLKTKFGQSLVDAAVIYLNAYETPVPPDPPPKPPDPVPPTPIPPTSGSPFQKLWDSTTQPQRSWNPALTITSKGAMDTWLANRRDNDHVIVKGFTYAGRLEIRGGGPFWMECDGSFVVSNRGQGSNYIGIWVISTNGAVITGFPLATASGNQGLRCQAAQNCYLEVDSRGNGGNGFLFDQIGGTGTQTGGVFKIRGGNNGLGAMPPGAPGYDPGFYSPDIDPHAQKGTGAHHGNVWRVAAGSVLLTDINLEQKYGAGMQTTGLAGTPSSPITLAIRAANLSCDVNKLPPSPSGGRQEGGNGWQPWGDAHTYVNVKAVELGKATRGVYGEIGGGSNCSVDYGRVQAPRQSPCWSAGGVTFRDISPKP